MSVSVNYTSKLLTTEVLETNVALAVDKTVQNGIDTTLAVTGASTPAATKAAYFEKALAAGVATIDLAALVGANGAAVDGSGLRVQFLKFRNKSTNANVISIAKGAANGYDGFGANFKITLPPSGEVLVRAFGAGAVISGTNKDLDLAGTLVQVAEIGIVLG